MARLVRVTRKANATHTTTFCHCGKQKSIWEHTLEHHIQPRGRRSTSVSAREYTMDVLAATSHESFFISFFFPLVFSVFVCLRLSFLVFSFKGVFFVLLSGQICLLVAGTIQHRSWMIGRIFPGRIHHVWWVFSRLQDSEVTASTGSPKLDVWRLQKCYPYCPI